MVSGIGKTYRRAKRFKEIASVCWPGMDSVTSRGC